MRKWEIGIRKWEVGMRKWEVGMRKWEVGMRKWEVGMRKWEFLDCGLAAGMGQRAQRMERKVGEIVRKTDV